MLKNNEVCEEGGKKWKIVKRAGMYLRWKNWKIVKGAGIQKVQNTGIPRLVRFFGPQQMALLEKPH